MKPCFLAFQSTQSAADLQSKQCILPFCCLHEQSLAPSGVHPTNAHPAALAVVEQAGSSDPRRLWTAALEMRLSQLAAERHTREAAAEAIMEAKQRELDRHAGGGVMLVVTIRALQHRRSLGGMHVWVPLKAAPPACESWRHCVHVLPYLAFSVVGALCWQEQPTASAPTALPGQRAAHFDSLAVLVAAKQP